jgi:hypothetical protein
MSGKIRDKKRTVFIGMGIVIILLAGLQDMDMADWMHVIEESVKICWFRIYSF